MMTAEQQPVDESSKPPKPMNPQHLRRTLYWLTLDWIHLQDAMPTPTRGGEKARVSNVKEYGHPAEWASVKSREIVDLLTGWHEYLADHRGETTPRKKRMRLTDEGTEVWTWATNDQQRLVAAWRYLEPRCEQLVELVDAEALKELPDLHNKIRHTLGHTTPKLWLPMPCPSCDQLPALQRTVGMGRDYIACHNPQCDYVVHDDPEGRNYKWLIRVALETVVDTLIDTNT